MIRWIVRVSVVIAGVPTINPVNRVPNRRGRFPTVLNQAKKLVVLELGDVHSDKKRADSQKVAIDPSVVRLCAAVDGVYLVTNNKIAHLSEKSKPKRQPLQQPELQQLPQLERPLP